MTGLPGFAQFMTSQDLGTCHPDKSLKVPLERFGKRYASFGNMWIMAQKTRKLPGITTPQLRKERNAVAKRNSSIEPKCRRMRQSMSFAPFFNAQIMEMTYGSFF